MKSRGFGKKVKKISMAPFPDIYHMPRCHIRFMPPQKKGLVQDKTRSPATSGLFRRNTGRRCQRHFKIAPAAVRMHNRHLSRLRHIAPYPQLHGIAFHLIIPGSIFPHVNLLGHAALINAKIRKILAIEDKVSDHQPHRIIQASPQKAIILFEIKLIFLIGAGQKLFTVMAHAFPTGIRA